MTSSRQLHLGAFMRPASIHTGAWRYPGAWPDMNFNFAHMKRCTQALERAKFDAFFMADHMAVLNMPNALKCSHTATSFEPFTLLSALSQVTERIGLLAPGERADRMVGHGGTAVAGARSALVEAKRSSPARCATTSPPPRRSSQSCWPITFLKQDLPTRRLADVAVQNLAPALE
jgi:hypothetical protein